MNPEDEHLHETVDAMLRAAPEPHPYAQLGARARGELGDGLEMAIVESVDDPSRDRPRRRGPAQLVLVAAVVLALVGGVWGISSLSGDGKPRRTATRKILTTPAAKALFAALGASTGTGGYEVNYEFTITPPSTQPTTVCGNPYISHGPPPAPTSYVKKEVYVNDRLVPTTIPNYAGCVEPSRPTQVTVTGSGKVYLNPYSLETTSTVTGLGEVTVRTDGNLIAEAGGANYGKLEDGQPISGFSSAVQATFGQGPGALTMLGLASPTGYLSLSANAVTDVTSAGTGTVNGAPVTYYDVVSDVNAMRGLPGLTDEQRKVVSEALVALDQAGFTEATARIAVDGAGYIVESTSKATFSDGATMNRHMTLSKLGCIGTGPTPAHPDGVPEPDPATCAPPPVVTTTIPTAPEPEPSTTTSSLPTPSSTQPIVTTSVPCPPPPTTPDGKYACAW